MNRNILYLVIGALAVVAVGLGYQVYQARQKTTGVEINIGERGISIKKNRRHAPGDAAASRVNFDKDQRLLAPHIIEGSGAH